MSEVLNTALFALDSACALSAFLFTKSIFENTRANFAKSFRQLLRDPKDETLFKLLDFGRQVSFWPRICINVIGWAILFIALLLRQTKALSGLGESAMTTIGNVCDVLTVSITVFMISFAVILFFHPQNKHWGFP